ncbi:MAG: acetolactate synthase large subunit, partial [Pirellulales bacterium]|nr:acetolactate synthase large subunit [Pirellulales bacterium]
PVLIDLPKDVQMAQTVPDYDVPMDLPGYRVEHLRSRPEQIAQVAAAIQRAKQPVIYAGGGVVASDASEELTELARKLRIPVTTTLTGLGGFPGDDELALGMLGMHGTVYANYAVNEADLLLAFGVRFDDRVTGKVEAFAERCKIVHIDVDPSEINKIKAAHIPIVSDVKYALRQLLKVAKPSGDLDEWHKKIATWKKEDPLEFDHDSPNILAQHAIHTLWELTKDRDPIIATGVGQHQMWAAQFFKFRRPGRWLSSGGLGTMGFGLPAALGAKAAHPDRLVINIDGDGSLLMNIQEMATSYCEKLPVKVMLLNNMHLGMVVQWEDRFNAGNRAHTYLGHIDDPEAIGQGDGIGPEHRYPDFVEIAKGFHWGGRRVWEKAELADAIREMIDAPGSFVLDVQVPYQEHVLPMIPAGMTVGDLIRE